MIRHSVKSLLLTAFLLFSSVSYAEISDRSLNKILDLSGLTEQVNQFPGLIKMGMNYAKQQGTPISTSALNSLVSSVDEAVQPSDIMRHISKALKRSLTEKEGKELLAWYESNVGRKITKAEESASTPNAHHHMMQLEPLLLKKTKRVNMAKRFDALLGATEMTMDMEEYSSISTYIAIMSALEPGKPVSIQQIKAQMDASIAQRKVQTRKMINLSFVYAYRTIDMQDLRKYERFLMQPTTVKFNEIIMKNMSKGIEQSIVKLSDNLSTIIRDNRR